MRSLHDRAILAVLLGCELRRSEVAALTFAHIQQRDSHRICIAENRVGATLLERFREPVTTTDTTTEQAVLVLTQ